ncbi:hypothetical protein EN829_008875 [Mesorhizobium sp. M00.F.Ca.ET.186.01.1.1]|nr:hypothetical protein EN848_04435 [bacterium M00.F.Ca.ET.205.01.1.1]TGU53344.1 hypothetical protein EN795_08850 [bacterium M00.F.Ca.ET.152.01.1.1]TGV36858.1 hypothetical protein EN829_008875 [Mesorhizobium sp. M00.F.Ca.ET.186.01.1.1]TGZ41727.1 hypothetical protein EN805_19575 [bacterium M00.F.Ca.ET.162.01.1.1]
MTTAKAIPSTAAVLLAGCAISSPPAKKSPHLAGLVGQDIDKRSLRGIRTRRRDAAVADVALRTTIRGGANRGYAGNHPLSPAEIDETDT